MIIAVTTVSPPVSDGQITIQSHTPVLSQHSLTYLPSPQRHSFCGGFMKCQPQPSHSPLALKSSIPYPFFQDQSSCTLLASQFWVWYLLPGSTSGYPSLASWILALVLSTPWLFGAAIPFPFSVNNHQPHLITLKLGKKHLTGNGTLNKTTLAPSKQPNNSLGKHADTSAGCILKQPCDILYNGHSHNLVLHPIIRYDGSAKVGTNIGFLQIIQMILHMTLCMTWSTCGKSTTMTQAKMLTFYIHQHNLLTQTQANHTSWLHWPTFHQTTILVSLQG